MHNTSSLPALSALAAALLLAGCSMIPAYERPAAPVATTWPAPAATAPASQAAADIDWRDFFSDARLRRLIELALQNNRDLRIAVLNIEQARAQYQIKRADQLPSVSAAVTETRQNPSATGPGLSSVATAGLSVTSYELDFFGRVRALSQSAQASFLTTEEARKTVQISLVASVANGYLNWLADNELLALTRETLTTREESLKLTKLRFDNGVASELDYAQARSLLEAAKATLAQAQRQRAQDENALVLLLGQPIPADLPAGPELLSGVPLLADVPAGLPSDLLTRRPDIRQAEQQLLSANASIGAARAAFFPSITLTASVGRASTELSNLFSGGAVGAWSWAPQLVLPIFDAGRNQARLDSARAGRDIAVAQYEKAIQGAFREVADALAGRATLGEQLRAQQAQVEAETTRYKLSDLRYSNGVASYLDLLDAQRSLFTARQGALQIQLAQLQNQVTLYKSLGGGWKEPAAAPAS
ncbi:efflux transporter outer membrane subunit [Variovorax terrae]|uniref:Efflux transporter outer membrane subunit n=1 Tax=Variovorax terrae TaxID=2923278 RepID=A0A9X2ANB0_9BURK|nr:efflux transporter outer membrane subunit [Variovorax terrae]MCJ0764628.1 efflux transporter outer membrane subunit [Variovorax terrae]